MTSKWLPLTHTELLRWKAQQVRVAQDSYEVDKEETTMTSKQALQDLFTISNKITKDKLNLDTKEIFERYKVIREDLGVLQELKEILLKAHRIEDHVINQDGDEVKHEVVDAILPVIYVEGKIKEWLENE